MFLDLHAFISAGFHPQRRAVGSPSAGSLTKGKFQSKTGRPLWAPDTPDIPDGLPETANIKEKSTMGVKGRRGFHVDTYLKHLYN